MLLLAKKHENLVIKKSNTEIIFQLRGFHALLPIAASYSSCMIELTNQMNASYYKHLNFYRYYFQYGIIAWILSKKFNIETLVYIEDEQKIHPGKNITCIYLEPQVHSTKYIVCKKYKNRVRLRIVTLSCKVSNIYKVDRANISVIW
jgi:hypothetical protein